MMHLTELLKGCRPIRDAKENIVIQTIGNMQVVCLTCDPEFSINGFANPLSVLVDTSRGYGNLTIHNNTEKPIIIPSQSAYLVNYQAQDHATAKAVYVGPNSRKNIDDSRCVESSQPGAIRSDEKGLNRKVLPFHLKEMSFEKVNAKGYNLIWEDIAEFNSQVSVNGGSHIKFYFKTHEKKLNEYIAHFERPKNVIGTVVLIDGEIVAIDKFPSFTYAEQIWDVLIRDCYGSLALLNDLKQWAGENLFTKTLQTTKRQNKESEIQYLQRVLEETRNTQNASVLEKLQESLELIFEEKNVEWMGRGISSRLLQHEGYIGQVISEGDFHHLVSIVKKKAFQPQQFRQSKQLQEKAKRQSWFTMLW